MNSHRPIGFFDSGVGGVSVLKQAAALLPHENFIYLGDNANMPYGDKSEEEILKLSLACGDFLYGKGVKAIVVACNTATSIAVHTMREKYRIPVISIEPAVKRALDEGRDGRILVMATRATLTRQRYQKLVDRLGARERVIDAPCHGLAELIEACAPGDARIRDYVRGVLARYAEEDIASVVLGCTHYSFAQAAISDAGREFFGQNCAVFDGNAGVARQLGRVLQNEHLLHPEKNAGSVDFYVTGDKSGLALLERFYSQAT